MPKVYVTTEDEESIYDTEAAQRICMHIRSLKEVAHPLVFESTPPVLSIGLRCVHHGYTFIWSGGRYPSFVTRRRQMVLMRVVKNMQHMMDDALFDAHAVDYMLRHLIHLQPTRRTRKRKVW